jgi:hypothetical protein
LAGDNYRIWYTAGSYGTAGDPQALNDVDDYYLRSEWVTVTIDDGTHTPVELEALTSLSIAATFNRTDNAVIGTNVKIKDTQSYDVAIALGGFVKSFPIEEALMGQAGQSWPLIDYNLFQEVEIVVKVYGEAAKTNFLIGYKCSACAFDTSSANSFNANDFGSGDLSLATDNLIITTDIGNL